MSAGFTSGPWRRGKSERFRNDIMAPDGLPIAHMAEYLPAYRALSEANAALIASAPKLYLSLVEARDLLEALGWEAVVADINDTLAQARGDLVNPSEVRNG